MCERARKVTQGNRYVLTMNFKKWFPYASADSQGACLVCLPYAGGNSQIYKAWSEKLPFDVLAAELPGRGMRRRDEPIDSLTEIVRQLVGVLEPVLKQRPFGVFGHSMGGLIGYELARALSERGLIPKHLFVSGRGAAEFSDHSRIHDGTRQDVIEYLRESGGTPEEVLNDPDLMDMIIPMFRADCAVTELYEYVEREPLSFPLTVFGAEHDREAYSSELEAWSSYTTAKFGKHMFDTGHFFLEEHESEIHSILRAGLAGSN
jgi:medium-chain acyl-[acyl-carrier-protein] hydrolase